MIFNYKKRISILDSLKKLYATKLMDYELQKKFLKLINVFDTTQKGCLDYRSFVVGIQRASPETD